MDTRTGSRVDDDFAALSDADQPGDVDEFDGWDEALDDLMWAQEEARLQAEWAAQHTPRPVGLLNPQELLDELAAAERELAAVQARRWQVLAEVERRGASEDTVGLSAAGWLVHCLTHSARRAKGEVKLAVRIAAEPLLVDALADGRISTEQAERIGHGLGRLPDELSSVERTAVAEQLVGFAAEFGPDALSRLVNHAVEVVAPEVADAADQRALERLERRLQRDRYLSIRQDHDGAWHLNGMLPPAAGAQAAVVLNALATRARIRAEDGELAWGQAMADALGIVFGHYSSCGQAPDHGADRPRVTVMVQFDTLRNSLGAALLVDADTPITAQQARLLACDADILPMVMGSTGVPLDVGREKRLFTGPLRQAIIARDKGCVFPGCDRPPADCEAHHVVPWWAGGPTSLANGVMLCLTHHHLVEPDPTRPPEQQWEVLFDDRRLPYFRLPANPRHPGHHRPTRQHHRFQA